MKYRLEKVDTVVLAGGINRIPLFDGHTPGYKGLLPVGGRPLITYTLDALLSGPVIHRVCIVGPYGLISEALADPGLYEYEPAGETLLDSISSGLEHFKYSEAVLFVTADLPLLTAGAVIDFLGACRTIDTPYDANIFWSMVPEQSFEGPFQEVRKGFNRFRDIAVCHGNLLLITPGVIQNRRLTEGIKKVYKKRKSSVLSALAFGPAVGLTYFFGVYIFRALTLNQMSFLFSKYFDMGLIPVVHRHPGSAIDIDTPQDYRFVCDRVEEMKHAGSF